MESNGKFKWDVEVVLYGNDRSWRMVETETESWYDAEGKILALPGVWDVGDHYVLHRPDGTVAFC